MTGRSWVVTDCTASWRATSHASRAAGRAHQPAHLEPVRRRDHDVQDDHVWDSAYEGGSNVVDVYVRYLREKVDRPFGRSSIQIRGSGYRLSTPGDG